MDERDDPPDYTLWLAASGHGGDTFAPTPEAAYAWRVDSRDEEGISERDATFMPTITDYHMAAILNAAVEAFDSGTFPSGSSVRVVSDIDFFVRRLNEDRSVRRLNGYRRRATNRPFPCAEKWRKFDVY